MFAESEIVPVARLPVNAVGADSTQFLTTSLLQVADVGKFALALDDDIRGDGVQQREQGAGVEANGGAGDLARKGVV